VAFDLGLLKNLKLREVWAHEEREFTPWLAQEENMAQLSAAIGLELQLEHVEVPVGPFCADILAKDPSVGFVVIENQFGKTNHDHLGKLLTYAAALGAGAVIWIAETFTEEHQRSIEWLNDHTNDDLSLYAVQLEVLQIDGSKPAIRFNVLSQPNEVVRAATVAKTSGTITEAQRLQLEFWTMFRNRLIEKKVLPSAQTPRPQYWFDVALGRSNIFLSNIVDTYAGRIGARVYLRHMVADAALDQLGREKQAIEAEIGSPLQWNPNPDKRDKIIALFRQVDLNDRTRWPEYCEWLVETVIKFRRAFMPRVRLLKLDGSESAMPSQNGGLINP
jgi:hypothetical protein